MKIESKLTISPVSFYEQLLESVRFDIRASQNEEPDKLYEGFTYHKKLHTKMGSQKDVEVTLMKLKENTSLGLEFAAAMGTTNVLYEIQEKKDGVYVIYHENFTGTTYKNNLNHKLVSYVFALQTKSKFKKTLRQIEAYCKENGS